MPSIFESADVTDEMIAEAAKWYETHDVPEAFRSVDPRVLKTVRELAGNDWQRCVVNPDGSVTVHNNKIWTREEVGE